ncbi:MAG: 5'/3'-nucleotidase SurE [Rubellimicrobium sp.]|nr:5'/3'-nucleotidase SurE [Rubellimicrobium sp.]
MRILVTNDDGINAPGLAVLESIAADIAGPGGEVWVVAPAFEQSGVGHAISFIHPTMITGFGPRRFAAEGSPADCVMAGIHDVVPGGPPDLVLSGVNRGNNAGENVAYSGTIGAAMEAALQGVNAIALSQFFGPENLATDDPFDAARAHGTDTVRRILDHADWGAAPYSLFYNVNFPPVPARDVRGTRVTRQGFRRLSRHRVEHTVSPAGRRFLWVHSGPQDEMTGEGTDVQACVEGYVSITPLTADLTCDHAVARLRAGFGDRS